MVTNNLSRHLMTGIGAYFYIVWGIWLRYCLSGRADEVELVWPRMITSFPEVRERKTMAGKGVHLNGDSKKSR
jgi:dihydroceramidase